MRLEIIASKCNKIYVSADVPMNSWKGQTVPWLYQEIHLHIIDGVALINACGLSLIFQNLLFERFSCMDSTKNEVVKSLDYYLACRKMDIILGPSLEENLNVIQYRAKFPAPILEKLGTGTWYRKVYSKSTFEGNEEIQLFFQCFLFRCFL